MKKNEENEDNQKVRNKKINIFSDLQKLSSRFVFFDVESLALKQ